MSHIKTPGLDNIKATLDGSGTRGSHMLPVATSTEIIKRVWDESWVRNTINALVMSTQTLKIPKITAGITMQGTTDNTNTAATESTHTTDEAELVMKTIIGNAPIDKKFLAYSVATMMSVIKDDIVESVSDTEEDVFINGDTTSGASNINGTYHATNFPGGIVARDPRLEMDGLRHFARDASAQSVDASSAYLTSSHIRSAFAKLGKYARRKENLIILVSSSVAATILGWDELKTIDKYGPKATIVTGEIGKLFGSTVIHTSLVPDTLDANGVARSQAGVASGNRTVVLVFDKRSPLIGNPQKAERKFKVDVDDEPAKDRIVLIPKEDFAFVNRRPESFCQIIDVKPGSI